MKPVPPAVVPPVAPTASEALLDRGVEMTFPASDPVSVDHAFREADRRAQPDRDDRCEDAVARAMRARRA